MRRSVVSTVDVYSAQLSSIVLFGDAAGLNTQSRVFAVQREVTDFLGNEGDDLSRFKIYSQPVPEPEVDKSVSFRSVNESPDIRVGDVKIYGMSVSAVFQVGSNPLVETDNRTKHIRQLLKGKRPV